MTAKRKIRRGYHRAAQSFDHALSPAVAGGAPNLDIIPDGLLRREYAWRKADIMSEVVVPFCLAGGYALIGAGVGALLGDAGGVDPLTLSLGCALGAGAIAFSVITKRQLQSVWMQEEFGEDIEEPVLPPAPREQERVIIVNGFRDRQQYEGATRAAENSELARFVQRCETIGTAWPAHSGILSNRGKWQELRETLMRAGYAEWRAGADKPQQGWKLTQSAAEIIAALEVR